MNNPQVADQLNPLSREIKAISAKRSNKTEQDHAELARLQFLGSLYYVEGKGVVVPGEWLMRALVNAGGAVRKGSVRAVGGGTQIQRGLIGLAGQYIPLQYDGPRKPEELYAKGFYDRRLVNGSPSSRGGSLVPKTRAKFEKWGFDADVSVDQEQLDVSALEEYLAFAGRLVGVGDGRSLGFGRFIGQVKG
jgi:hypothetical protein